jgi:hypothetical protein
MPGQCRKPVLNVSASSRNRRLGTAFRSPVTTLSPPLRGQCSCPVPSLPRRRFPRIRSIETLPLDSVSTPKSGESQHSDPLSAGCPAAPEIPPVSTPLRVFQPSGSKRSTGILTGSPLCLTPGCPWLPAAIFFNFASDRCSEHRVRPALLSFRKPWN